MSGNIPDGNFLGGNFPGAGFPGGVGRSLMCGNFSVGIFPGGIFLGPISFYCRQTKTPNIAIFLCHFAEATKKSQGVYAV